MVPMPSGMTTVHCRTRFLEVVDPVYGVNYLRFQSLGGVDRELDPEGVVGQVGVGAGED